MESGVFVPTEDSEASARVEEESFRYLYPADRCTGKFVLFLCTVLVNVSVTRVLSMLGFSWPCKIPAEDPGTVPRSESLLTSRYFIRHASASFFRFRCFCFAARKELQDNSACSQDPFQGDGAQGRRERELECASTIAFLQSRFLARAFRPVSACSFNESRTNDSTAFGGLFEGTFRLAYSTCIKAKYDLCLPRYAP